MPDGEPQRRSDPQSGPPLRTALRESPGVVRLAIIRFTGQFGDGMFQAALSGAILFNPERETDPLAIAAGFAVLLLPYSLIGPYAGALLDRWDRRAVLLTANLLRIVLILAAAGTLAAGVDEAPLLLLALATVGVSRFVAAGVSAALPRVLAQHWLVAMNSVLATVASAFAGAGAAAAVVVIGFAGAGDTGSAIAVAVSAIGSVIGAVLAVGFRPHVLGPDSAAGDGPGDRPGTAGDRESAAVGTLRAIAAGLSTAARAVWRAPEVTTAMVGIGAHRVVFGANTLIMVLVLREPAESAAIGGGLVGFGVTIGAAATGMLVAAALAPWVIPRLGRPRTVLVGLAAAMIVQSTLVLPAALSESAEGSGRAVPLLLAAAFLFGLAGQLIKLTGDAAMQIDIDDTRRGRVFALQDTVFNMAFVLSIAATALVIPADGRSPVIVLAGAAGYALAIVVVVLNSRRVRRAP